MQMIKSIDDGLEKILSKPILLLPVIVLLGLMIRVYFTPWDMPTNSSDAFGFMIEGIAYSNVDFSNFNYRFLWPVFLSIFFGMFRFDDYFNYMTLVRIISISISLATIPIVYLVSREYVKEKYALIAAVLFTVESNLVENSIFGQTEPLFILLGLTSFYFILQKNQKYQLIAFVFAGLAFDTRLNGIVLLLLLIFTLLTKIKHKENSTRNLILGIILFSVISIPAHIIYPVLQGEEIFPFLKTIASAILEEHTYDSTNESLSDISSSEIIFNGIKNEIMHIFRISIPYLIILFPIGFIVALKNIDFKKKALFSLTIISLIVAIPQYSISNEFRNLFFLTPFFCIFSAIGIQELTDKIELKNLFLIFLVAGLILLSANFLRERYDIDKEYILEKDDFGKYVVNNFEGNISGNLRLEITRNMPDLKIKPHYFNDKLAFLHSGITINSIPKLMKYSEENKINFLIIEEQILQKHYPIFNEILINKNQYVYLEKILDSNELNYKKLKVKIFKINWDLYNEL